MQKNETSELYIAGLNIITDVKYESQKEIIEHKLLKWIVVKNNSDTYMTDFIDIKNNTKYYNSAMEKGELFIDLASLISLCSYTVKSKLSIEDCNFILEQFKREFDIDKEERKKAVFEIIENYSEIFDEDGNIIIQTLAKYGDEDLRKEEAFDILSDALEITKKGKSRIR